MNVRVAANIAYSGIGYDEPIYKVCCCICGDSCLSTHCAWNLPHAACSDHPEGEQFVCSKDCAKEWCERNWEYVEEYEEALNA